MRALLDVNVLVALLDGGHLHHGLAMDWLIQEGIELLARDSFETEIQAALASTQQEWQGKLLPPLLGAVDAWMDDTIQLLPRFEP